MTLPRARASSFLLLAAFLPWPRGASAQETVVYVVRHAERVNSEQTSPLSGEGRERALELARLLADTPLRSVLSTDRVRTRETAEPVAARHGLGVELYDAQAPAAVVARVRSAPGHHLLVGHSNTVPELVRLLGGDPGDPIADDEYDRLYVVVPLPGGEASASALIRFGRESGGKPAGLLEVAGHQSGGGP